MKPEVSIIIVHYKVEKELFACLTSLQKSHPKTSHEIIVVDNDEKKTIEHNLKRKFPEVIYLPNSENSGWGGGVNFGAKQAKGKYIFFLNPDTVFLSNAVDILYEYIKEKPTVGVAAAVLLDEKSDVYPLLGTQYLTPLRAIFSLSIINRLWPGNPIAQQFWLKGKDKSRILELDVAPLAGAIIRADVFREVGMFDEGFFLYFEEYDLARRLAKRQLHSVLIPEAKIYHAWGKSTVSRSDKNLVFAKSRQYFFRKYYGSVVARLVETIMTLHIPKF